MIQIKKGHAPTSLTAYKRQSGACYDDYANKQDLRDALTREQGNICCYCMGRIQATEMGMKIEHWECQSRFPGKQLEYKNLLGACRGGQGQPPSRQHCDTRKANLDLCRTPADALHNIGHTISYLPNGTIRSTDADLDKQLDDVLNLNLARLKENRAATLDAFLTTLPKAGTLTPAQWQAKFAAWHKPGTDCVPYLGIVYHYVRKKTGGAI